MLVLLSGPLRADPTSGDLRATPPPPRPCDVRPTTYVLAAGDRLSILAERFRIDDALLRQYNPGLEPGDMEVGEVIVLPLGPTGPRPNGEMVKEIRRGIRGRGHVALTFDAGADVGALDALLAVLRDREVRCSFFITGRWVDRHPRAFQRILDEGHETLSHTFSHRPLPELSREEILEELERTDRIFLRTAGRSARPYFRPPYGDRDPRVLEIAAAAGWQCIRWTLDTRDAVPPPKMPLDIVARTLWPPQAEDPRRFLDGAIILAHAAKEPTAQAMGVIIDGLRDRALEPVPLTTLLQPRIAENPLGPRPGDCRGHGFAVDARDDLR